MIASLLDNHKAAAFKRGNGCTHCNNTGYHGRIGVFEFLEIDEDLADALRREDSSAFARTARASRGFRSFAQHAMEYALQGITSIEEVIRVAGTIEEVQNEFSLDACDPNAALPN